MPYPTSENDPERTLAPPPLVELAVSKDLFYEILQRIDRFRIQPISCQEAITYISEIGTGDVRLDGCKKGPDAVRSHSGHHPQRQSMV